MNRNTTAGLPGQHQPWVTATEWFSGGQRVWYDPTSAPVLNEEEGVATAGALRVFERVAAPEHGVEHRRHTDRWDLAAIARNPATVTR